MAYRLRAPWLICAVLTLFVSGCGFFESDQRTEEQKREDAQRTRDEVAKATERAKPELQKAGKELKEAAKIAAEQAHAAGMDAHLAKPYTRGQLRDVLMVWL